MFAKLRSGIAVARGYWTELLHDIDGFPSSKRFGFVISVVVVLGSWIANIFFGIITDYHILDAALGLGGVSGAGIAAERFGKLLPPPGGRGIEMPDNP